MTKPKIVCVIPARYNSYRFQGKMLADVNGKPLLIRVWDNAINSELISKVFIATDDKRIFNVCQEYGADVIMTDPDLPSGTDRIIQALEFSNIKCDFVLNIQGDEPLFNSMSINQFLSFSIEKQFDVATCIKKIISNDEIFDSDIVKVVINSEKKAIYFSRSPIPFLRDLQKNEWVSHNCHYKHIGVYLYTPPTLQLFKTLHQSPLELTEKLEQLRLLEAGSKFLCYEIFEEIQGVDTIEQLNQIRKYF